MSYKGQDLYKERGGGVLDFVLCLVRPMMLVYLDCQFMISDFSNVYLITHTFTPVYLPGNINIYISKFSAYDTFLEYAHNQKIGIPNNFKVFGSKKTKGPNRIAKIS